MNQNEKQLVLPLGSKRLLVHSCCAPCSCEIIRLLKVSKIDFAVLFYNPNIDTLEEYQKRKAETEKYALKLGVKFYDLEYENDLWKLRIKGLEGEPEKGKRCDECFDLRMERTALFAYENGFDIFTSSIGISRYKDLNQISESGHKAAARYKNLVYWDFNFRKKGGLERSDALAKNEGFYRQKYCGCEYSKRNT